MVLHMDLGGGVVQKQRNGTPWWHTLAGQGRIDGGYCLMWKGLREGVGDDATRPGDAQLPKQHVRLRLWGNASNRIARTCDTQTEDSSHITLCATLETLMYKHDVN